LGFNFHTRSHLHIPLLAGDPLSLAKCGLCPPSPASAGDGGLCVLKKDFEKYIQVLAGDPPSLAKFGRFPP
jgi:hypothetical protein